MNQAWAHFRRSWLAALVVVLGSTSLARAQTDDLPELPPLPESPSGDLPEAPPAEAGPKPPPYMVEEPLAPPHQAPPGYSPYPPEHYYPYEPPPPPPPPPHVAPRSSFFLGTRFGFLSPFGKLTYDYPDGLSGPAWSDIAGSGFSFELNAGGRFARHFLVFALWEHGALGTGRDRAWGFEQTSAETHLFGAAFRFSSHPDDVGLAVEAGFGFRTFRADFANDVVVTATSPEVRIGIGADIRLSRGVTLSPMMQISNGTFLDLRMEQPGRPSRSIFGYEAPHGTFGFALGAHFDLFPSAK